MDFGTLCDLKLAAVSFSPEVLVHLKHWSPNMICR